jgi:hypothetical protein
MTMNGILLMNGFRTSAYGQTPFFDYFRSETAPDSATRRKTLRQNEMESRKHLEKFQRPPAGRMKAEFIGHLAVLKCLVIDNG